MTWPVCAAAIRFSEIEMVCVLPRDHGYDGSKFHRDKHGNEWRVSLADGRFGIVVSLEEHPCLDG